MHLRHDRRTGKPHVAPTPRDARGKRAFGGKRTSREEVKERFASLEAESKTQSALLGKVIDAVTELAKGQEKIAAAQQIHGSRLNTMDARLAGIEREIGLVKA